MHARFVLTAIMLSVPVALAAGQELKVHPGPLSPANLAVPDSVVPDAFIVELDPLIARVVDVLQTANVNSTGVGSLDALTAQLGVREFRKQFPGADSQLAAQRGLPDLSGYYVVTFDPARATLPQALAAYRTDPNVRSVQSIGIHPVSITPNDGNFATQWHLNQTSDKDMDAPEAWNLQTGAPSTIVAVLDTGVRYYHRDLGGSNASAANPTAADGNMWINLAERNGAAGIDDDSNGFVDDWVGYDFVTGVTGCSTGEDCSTPDNDPRDFNGHGTHCAGNVAAINNNGYATASPSGGWGNGTLQPTANGVKVMAMRIGWSTTSGGFVRMDFAASALYYAANKGARIASCSWGSSNSGGIAAALDYFVASGGLVFKAAGNANSQTADYMCSRSDVYCVAATDQNDQKASFSSYGTWVDISAPGVSILSTYHNSADPNNDYVASISGTSMATPLTASGAALVWSANPTWTAGQVWTRLRDTADNINALNPSYVGLLGSGRVNLFNAVNGTGPFCGNNVCDPGETPCNCPQDCGSPPATETNCSDGIDNDCDGLTDCADPDCSSAPNCAPAAAIVDCITYTTSGGQGGTRNIVVTVKIVNNSNNPVSGASVSVSVSGPTNFSATGTTNTSGNVSFTKKANNGCYTTNVTNVTATGLTYDGTEPPNGFRKGTDATPDADCRSGNDPCG